MILDLSGSTELDIQTADMLGELAAALRRDGIELCLAEVRAPALEILAPQRRRRAGARRGDARRGL